MAVSFVLFFVSVLVLSGRVESEPVQEEQKALLRFISGTKHPNWLQWKGSVSVCDWVGVKCDATRSFVSSVRLPGVGLVGPIPPNTLGLLRGLRALSLRFNGLCGEIPSDFSNLTSLRNLYLQSNNFSGGFPESVTRLGQLLWLDLSSNHFSGPIPLALNNLTQLTGLFLENNNFSGNLPSMNCVHLVGFNVSNNNLNGPIPHSLANFNESALTGNPGLCGAPLHSCNPVFSPPASYPCASPSPDKSRRDTNSTTSFEGNSNKLQTIAIIAIPVGSAIVALLLLLFLILCLRRQLRQPPEQKKPPVVPRPVATEEGTSSSKDDITCGSAEAERNKLVFYEGAVYSFELEDLLRASTEVLE